MAEPYRLARCARRMSGFSPPGWGNSRSGTGLARQNRGRDRMAMVAGEIEALIRAALPDASVTIEDLAGDGDHSIEAL